MSDASRPMEIFAIGDTVCPSSSMRNSLANLHLKEGEVCVVVKVMEVPNKCNCGRPLPDKEHQEYGCPYARLNPQYGRPVRVTVGHIQWLVVRRRDEEAPIQSTLSSFNPCQFSGKWFTHASP